MSYLRVLIIGLISYLGVTNYLLRSKVNSLDNDLSKAKNNIEAYQSMLNNPPTDACCRSDPRSPGWCRQGW